jgi:hypothetical protein
MNEDAWITPTTSPAALTPNPAETVPAGPQRRFCPFTQTVARGVLPVAPTTRPERLMP